MLGLLLFITGFVLVVLMLFDFLKTTTSLSGLGPISSRIAFPLWTAARHLAPWSERRLGRDIRGFLGPAILAAIAGAWIGLPLAGYTLMYSAGPALSVSETGETATLLDRIAFSGSALSTLGASIVSPTNGWWDVLSMVAPINGMIVLTLSVSFILTVLRTTLSARGLAVRFHALLAGLETIDPTARLNKVKGLGADLCVIAVELSASPLPGMFVPSNPAMNFPAVVSQLCALIARSDDARGNTSSATEDFQELRWALAILGRHANADDPSGNLAATQAWASRFSLPAQ